MCVQLVQLLQKKQKVSIQPNLTTSADGVLKNLLEGERKNVPIAFIGFERQKRTSSNIGRSRSRCTFDFLIQSLKGQSNEIFGP